MVTVCLSLYRMSSKGKHYRNVRRPVAASGWGTQTSREVGLRGVTVLVMAGELCVLRVPVSPRWLSHWTLIV